MVKRSNGNTFENWASNKFSKRRNYENFLFSWEIFWHWWVRQLSKRSNMGTRVVLMPIKKSGIKQRRKFAQQVMVWLCVCSKGIMPLVILDEGTVDHTVYIKKVLPVALKYGNETCSRLNLSTGWRQATFVSFSTRMVSRQFSIISWQCLLSSN